MDWKEQLSEIKNTIVEREEVFDAIRRGNSQFSDASNDEILHQLGFMSAEELQGHVNNTKGIVFEQEVQEKFEAAGIESRLHEATNHPGSDIQILEDEAILEEVQLKATDSASYINDALEANPETAVIATSEVANEIGTSEVVDSGISNSVLEESVVDVISPIPVSIEGVALRVGLGLLTGGLGFFF